MRTAKLQLVLQLAACTLITACNVAPHWGSNPHAEVLKVIVELHDAEARYLSLHGRYGTLQDLGPDRAGLVSRQISSGKVHGFRMNLDAEESHYKIQATPLKWGVTGTRSFYSDETRLVRATWGPNTATSESAEFK